MDAGDLWVALLSLAGTLMTLVGLVGTWWHLRAVWLNRWQKGEVSPRLHEFLQSIRQTWIRWIRRPRPVHGTLNATAPTVRVGPVTIRTEWNVSGSGTTPERRLENLERAVNDLRQSLRDNLKEMRTEMQTAVAEVTDDARAHWARNDADAREQLRIALWWPAALIVLGTFLQVCAACISLAPFISAAVAALGSG